MPRDRGCIFCQIIAGETVASIVYQDRAVTAFMDLYPASPGHVLVVPNDHAALITEVEPAILGCLFEVGVNIDRALRKTNFRCEGVSIYLADGAAAGQAVFHTHLHVIPRFPGDSCGLRLHASPADSVTRPILDQHAESIRRHLLLSS